MRGPSAAACIALVFGLAAPVRAQYDSECFPPKGSNEARTMASFAVPLAFSGAAAPGALAARQVRIGLEISLVPDVDRATATPTFCRPDKGPENTDLLFAAPRPRVAVTLPAGFTLEGSWTPPIRVSDVKANLLSFAVSRSTALRSGGAVLSVRAHGTVGVIKAPVTCNDQALEDAASICYQGTRSDDAFKPNIFGVELAVGWRLGPTLRPYLGAGYSHLAPRFQVNFTDQFGDTDRRKVIVDLQRGALFAGVTWTALPTVEVSGELYSVPADATIGRVIGRIRLGRSSGALHQRPVSRTPARDQPPPRQ